MELDRRGSLGMGAMRVEPSDLPRQAVPTTGKSTKLSGMGMGLATAAVMFLVKREPGVRSSQL